MMCLNREGKSKCTWWIIGCINPNVSVEVKKLCNGQLPHYNTQEIESKISFYHPPVQKTVLGISNSNDGEYLKRGTK